MGLTTTDSRIVNAARSVFADLRFVAIPVLKTTKEITTPGNVVISFVVHLLEAGDGTRTRDILLGRQSAKDLASDCQDLKHDYQMPWNDCMLRNRGKSREYSPKCLAC